MALEVWLAPPAGGKTEFCLRTVRQFLSEEKLKKTWVLVPDRRQADSFRNQLIQQGGLLGVHIGSFEDLCQEILFSQNEYLPLLNPALRHRILRESIRENEEGGTLTVFSSITNLPGFQGLLHRIFNEFCQAGVVNGFTTMAETAQQAELLALYQSYLKLLDRIQWIDPQGLNAYTNQVLQKGEPLLWPLPDLVVLDGFDRFTLPQLQLISWMEKLDLRLIITQTAETKNARMVNQRFERSINQINQTFPEVKPVWISHDSFLPPDLKHISRNLLNVQIQPVSTSNSIRLLALQSPLEEVREVLRWVKQKLVVAENLPSDVAVIIPDEATYQPLLKAIAREYGLRLNFSSLDFLSEHPAVQILETLFQLIRSDYPRRLLIDVVRSPYLDLSGYGLLKQDAVAFDLVSRYGLVMSGVELWQQVLAKLAASETIDNESSDFEYAETMPHGEEAQRLFDGLQQLALDLVIPDKTLPVSGWVTWLANLLEKLGWADNLEKMGEKEVVESFRTVMDGQRLGELTLGAWVLDFPQFYSVLQGALGVVAYAKPSQENKEKVPVLRMIEARGVRFKHTAILGLAEGSFPIPIKPDPFLPDDFRQKLGLETRLDQEQASVFYLAFTRADQSMLITRPYLTNAGEPLEPSPYWNAIKEIVGADKVSQLKPGEHRDLSTAASLQELAFWAWSQQGGLPSGFEAINETLYHQRSVLDARISREHNLIYDGRIGVLPDEMKGWVAGDRTWSPSRLETYKKCAYWFWTQYSLGLVEQTILQPGLQASQLGSMLHQILEEVYPEADDPSDPESVVAALPKVAQRVFEAAPQKYGFIPTPLWTVEQTEWMSFLKTAIYELSIDGWKPLAYEQKFGLQGSPPLTIMLEDGRKIKVRGVIDRLDEDENGSLRVVDYKTGSSHLDPKELLNGQRLQLPIYALAAAETFPEREVRDGFYWALRAQKAGSLKLAGFEYQDLQGFSGAAAVLREHLAFILDGMEEANFQPKVPEGGCASYCPARFWCWHFEPERWA